MQKSSRILLATRVPLEPNVLCVGRMGPDKTVIVANELRYTDDRAVIDDLLSRTVPENE